MRQLIGILVALLISGVEGLGAMEPMEAEKGLYIVLGTSRAETGTIPMLRRLLGAGEDFTHRKTFGGKAATLDTHPCSTPGLPHILEEPKTFNPGQDAPIRGLYLDFFPSYWKKSPSGTEFIEYTAEELHTILMYMPQVIENMAQYMVDGAPLEIEHWPHSSTLSIDSYGQIGPFFRTYNPFHCILSPIFMEALRDRKNDEEESAGFWKDVAQKLCSGPDAPSSGFVIKEAIDNRPLLKKVVTSLGKSLKMAPADVDRQLFKEYEVYKKNLLAFCAVAANSLSVLIIQQFAMVSQQDAMRSCLEAKGFEGVKITQGKSQVTGRDNVWLISAKKKGGPSLGAETK